MSRYFSLRELCRSDKAASRGIDNTPTPEAIEWLGLLATKILDPLRDAWGEPFAINSGYRSPELNRAIGGSKTSQHVLGQAADIQTSPKNENMNYLLLHMILDLNLPFDQLICEHPNSKGHPSWIHVSIGPKNRRQLLTIQKGGRTFSGIRLVDSLWELGIM